MTELPRTIEDLLRQLSAEYLSRHVLEKQKLAQVRGWSDCTEVRDKSPLECFPYKSKWIHLDEDVRAVSTRLAGLERLLEDYF